MQITDLLVEYPWVVPIVAIALRALLAWQSSLSWPEYRTLHGIKRLVFPVLDRRVPVLSWVNAKGGRDDAEYLTTVDTGVRATTRRLIDGGGRLHLLNSIKRRDGDAGDPFTLSHVVWLHGDGTQTEAYLFRNDDGTTDVYAHHEPAPSKPLAHLGGEDQSDGDVRGVVTDALA